MSWLDNVVVVGTPVDGIATVRIPLPGSNMSVDANFRETVLNVALLEDPAVPTPVGDGFYPILSSVKW